MMTDNEIHKLAELFEDVVYFHTELDEFDYIMPQIATVLYDRYCINPLEARNKISGVVLPPIYHP